MQAEVYQIIDDYLKLLSEQDGASLYDMTVRPRTTLGANAIAIMKQYGLILFRNHDENSSIIDITLAGGECLKSGVENYIKEQEAKQSPGILHIGHNINAPVSQSDFSNSGDNSFSKQNTTETNNLKTSKTEKLYWIAGIVVGLIAVYEFLHQIHLVIKF